MPKETLRLDKFIEMKPSTADGSSLALLSNIRCDISPNLVPEQNDDLVSQTAYMDYKTITVNGTLHSVGVTTAGVIIVDGASYGSMPGSKGKITIFGSVALIINPDSNASPAKIVTFGTDVENGVFDTSTTLVSNDLLETPGGVSDIDKFVVLNSKLAIALFVGDYKLQYVVLDDFDVYTSGMVIACEEFERQIIKFDVHYDEVDVDYAVFAYYDESGYLCFGRYDIASWFTDGETHDSAKFVKIVNPTDIYDGTIRCGPISSPDGSTLISLAVTLEKVFWQYYSEAWGTYIDNHDIEDEEDVLYSARLSNFPVTGSVLIEEFESGWTVNSIQKSKLPIYYPPVLDYHYADMRVFPGIAILSYEYNEVGLDTRLHYYEKLPGLTERWMNGFMCWSGEQPYDTTVGTPYLGIDDIHPKAFDSDTNHSDGNCYRWFQRYALMYTPSTHTPHTLSSAVGWKTSYYRSLIILHYPDGLTYGGYEGYTAELFSIAEYMEDGFEEWALYDDMTYYDDLGVEFSLCAQTITTGNFSIVPEMTDDMMFTYADREINRIEFAIGAVWPAVVIDDTTPLDTIITDLDFITLEETNTTSESIGFEAGTTRYAYSFIYDGYQESPLSVDKHDTTNTYSRYTVDIILTISANLVSLLSKRITGINLYSAPIEDGVETELYRLVKSLPLSYDMFSVSGNTYVARVQDNGNRLASFNAVAGFSESLKSVSVNRAIQCACLGYVFVADADVVNVDEKVPIGNIVIRSLPLQPSVFDYSENFVTLPFTALAMAEYNNRLYVFGSDEYAIVNPETMGIEFKSSSIGCLSTNHLVSTEYGIFIYFNNNVYAIESSIALPIGNPIKTSAYSSETDIIVLDDITTGVYLFYLKKRTSLLVMCSTDSVSIAYMYSIFNKRWVIYDMTHSECEQLPDSAYECDGIVYVNYDELVPES